MFLISVRNCNGMEKLPLFSILIANYNNGCYLQDAIDSVLAQNYDNWEIVIVDDKSTDNSFEIYEKYKNDGRFHVFFNEENKGCGYTKHRCAELANGEICGFLDPDDVLVGTEVFNVMTQTHLANPDASAVFSNMYVTDEHLNNVQEYDPKPFCKRIVVLDSKGWPLHHFFTFKKDLYLQTEGIDPEMRRAVDYDMYYKLEEVGEIVHVDAFFYKQRNNPHSISLNDNGYKAAVWHSYACVQAMKRRGLTDESLMLFPVEGALKREYLKGCEKIWKSKIYRIGKLFVSPLLFINGIWKK